MRRSFAFVTVALALLVSRSGFPCGGSFGANVAVNPQQDIIVGWKDGIETYAFQPIFCGTATDFGLILPVPAALAQSPSLVDAQAFTAIADLAAPEKVEVSEGHGFGCGAGGSEAAGGGMNGMQDDTTTVVASGQVGFLDWVQLKADTAASFTDWLDTNGYPYSATATSVFSHYVEQGWYFLAFRISQQAAPGGATICKALGPVGLAFPAQAPVVPTRMATAGTTMPTSSSGRFAWRIFGITRGTEQLGTSGLAAYTLGYSGEIGAADVPSLGGLAEAGDRLTRLMVRFAYGSTDPDLILATYPPRSFRDKEYITIHDDAACSLGGTGRRTQSFVLTLVGLGMAGLLCWRRWR